MGRIASSFDYNLVLGVFTFAVLVAALVLGIMAVAQGSASKRLLRTQSTNTDLNGKAQAAIVLGWAALSVVGLFWVIHFATRKSWMPF